MRKIDRSLKNYVVSFMFYFTFYTVVSLIINLKTYPTQGVNDDEFFAQLVSGEFTGTNESFTHISPASPQWFFGFLLTKFYLISSTTSWYYLILLITVLLSLTFITILMSRNFLSLNQEKIVILILSILFLLWFVPSPTYTSTAFISSLAGVIGFVIGIKNRSANFYFIIPCLKFSIHFLYFKHSHYFYFIKFYLKVIKINFI